LLSSAPVIIPLFPFNKLYAILMVYLKEREELLLARWTAILLHGK